jgi:hypothetical protein
MRTVASALQGNHHALDAHRSWYGKLLAELEMAKGVLMRGTELRPSDDPRTKTLSVRGTWRPTTSGLLSRHAARNREPVSLMR